MVDQISEQEDVLLEKNPQHTKILQRIGLIFGCFSFVSIILELYIIRSIYFIYFGLALGLISYLCIFDGKEKKQNKMEISPKRAVFISSLFWVTGIAIFAKILPAGQSIQNDKELLFWFVIYFYAPLSFAINLPAWGLYSRILLSGKILYCIICLLLPLAALSYGICTQYDDIEELIPFVLIFGPTIYYILRFYLAKNRKGEIE